MAKHAVMRLVRGTTVAQSYCVRIRVGAVLCVANGLHGGVAGHVSWLRGGRLDAQMRRCECAVFCFFNHDVNCLGGVGGSNGPP